jgi:AbrB family looped-hinge helix DNA binding protein
LVIPAKLRRELGLEEGATLAIRSEGGRLILEPREEVLRRLRGRFAQVADGRLLSEELIAERREEARRESGS